MQNRQEIFLTGHNAEILDFCGFQKKKRTVKNHEILAQLAKEHDRKGRKSSIS